MIYPLREVAPEVSSGVVYLLAVLLVAVHWGLAFGLLTSLVSAAAFNFFHIPPTGRLMIADSAHWVALVVFLVAAVVASAVADLARTPPPRPSDGARRPTWRLTRHASCSAARRLPTRCRRQAG